MDFGSYIGQKIRNFANTVENGAQQIGTTVGNDVSGLVSAGVSDFKNLVGGQPQQAPPTFSQATPDNSGAYTLQPPTSSPQPQQYTNLQQAPIHMSTQPQTMPIHLAPQPQGNNLASFLAKEPKLQVPNIGIGSAVNKDLGGGIPGAIGQGVADFAPNMVNSVVNAPGDFGRAALQLGKDSQNRTPQQGLDTQQVSDLANLALPVATVASLGEGGAALQLGKQGLRDTLLQGGIQGAKFGAGFGAAGAIAGNRNVSNPVQYGENVLQGAGVGAVTGGILGVGLGAGGYGIRNLPKAVPVDPGVEPEPGSAEKSLTDTQMQQYGKDLQTPQAQAQLQQHLGVAQQVKPVLDNDFQQLAQANGAEFSSRIKTPDTALQKIVLKRSQGRDYGIQDINDSYGGRITIADSSQLPTVLSQIQQLANKGNFEVLGGEPVQKDTYNAYHIDIQTPDQQVGDTTIPGARGEIQVMLPQEKAESLANHGIRAEYGENPPPQVEAIKDKNADIVNSLPEEDAEALSKQMEAQNEADPDRASEPLQLVEPEDSSQNSELSPGQQAYVHNYPNVHNEDGTQFVPKTIEQLAGDYKNANAYIRAMRTMQQPKEISQEFQDKYNVSSQKDIADTLRSIFNDRTVEERLANIVPRTTTRAGGYTNVPEYDPRTPAQKSFETGEPIVSKEDTGGSSGSTGVKTLRARSVEDAVANRSAVIQNIQQRSKLLMSQLNRAIRPEDTELFRNTIEHPGNLEKNATKASNPTAFKDVVSKWEQFTDSVHTYARQSGKPLGYIEDYYSHVLDLSTPKAQAIYDNIAKNFKGYMSKDRIFATIDELRAKGLDLKNDTVQQDLQDYTNSAIRGIGSSALRKGLDQATPSEVADISEKGGIPRDDQGQAYIQLKIPGLEDTAVSPRLYKLLRYLEPAGEKTVPGKIYDMANTAFKESTLGGGLFHLLNTTNRKLGKALVTPSEWKSIVPDMAKVSLSVADASGKYQQKLQQEFVQNGGLEKASQMGVTFGNIVGGDVPDLSVKGKLHAINYANPLTWIHSATFDRAISNYKMQAVRNANIDGLSPQQVREVGAQINNLYGGINHDLDPKLLQRSAGIQRIFHRAALAPDFLEGTARILGRAINPTDWSSSGKFAKQAVFGQVVATAIAVEAFNRWKSGNWSPAFQQAFGGKMPTATQIGQTLQQDVLQPSFQLSGKNQRGEKEVAAPPTTMFGELAGAVEDPVHFAIARTAMLPSLTTQLATNTNYYGDPLVSPYAKGNPIVKGLQAVGSQVLPIPVVQAQKIAQGQSLRDAALNTAGLRVHVDPNDPTVQYFNIRDADKATANLNPNDLSAWNSLHPQTSADGNRVFYDSTLTTQQRATTYLNNPNVLALDNKINQDVAKKTGQPIDPFFNLSKPQQAFVNSIDALPPGEGSPDKTSAYAQPWYQNYENNLTSYFNQLPKSTLPQAANANLPQSLPISPQLQQQLNAYDALPSGTGAKTAYLKTNPDVNNYLNASADLVNMKRADINLPLNVTSYTVLPALTPTQIQNAQTLESTYNNLPYGQGARSTFLQKNQDLLHYFEEGGDTKFATGSGTGGSTGMGSVLENNLVMNGNAVSPLVQNPNGLSTSNYKSGSSSELMRSAERKLILSSMAYPSKATKLFPMSTRKFTGKLATKAKPGKPIAVAGSHVKRLRVAGMGKPKISTKNPEQYASAGQAHALQLRPIHAGYLGKSKIPRVSFV